MTDRELLELAAKAAGIVGKWVTDYGSGDYYYQGNMLGIYIEHGLYGRNVWNPLLDDGDALRLAVKLCMSLLIGDGGTVSACVDNSEHSIKTVENYLPCHYAATRRAIVRAAAEIGSGM